MNHDRFLELFKYRSLASPYGRASAEDIILHHRMFWQSPAAFNDPFDCDPVVFFGSSDRERRDWIKRMNATSVGTTNRLQRRQKKRELSNRPPAEYEELLRSSWREWMGKTGVCCFSGVNDHQLMWGHYADSHRGVCFVFQEQSWNGGAWIAFDVNYSAERPLVNLTQLNDVNVMQDSLLNKSEVWSYEEEYRMIDWRVAPGFREFPPPALKGVILGARISNDDREFMLGLASRRPHLKVWQAECDPLRFALNIVEA